MTAVAALPMLTSIGSAVTGSSVLGAISTGLTLASGAMSLFGGNQAAYAEQINAKTQARALELSAQEDLLSAKEEEIKGKQDSNNIMDTLIQTIASQRLATAGNGVDTSFGTPVSVEDSTRKIANLQMGITRDDALVRSLSRRRQAWSRREEAMNVLSAGKENARAARNKGIGGALGSINDLVMRRIERG